MCVCVCVFFEEFAKNVMLATCMMNSLKAINKLINGKSNRKPRMEGAGDESGSGCIFTSAASEKLRVVLKNMVSTARSIVSLSGILVKRLSTFQTRSKTCSEIDSEFIYKDPKWKLAT